MVYEALAHGATVGDVVAAAGLDRDQVRAGLAGWVEWERAADDVFDGEHDAVSAILAALGREDQ